MARSFGTLLGRERLHVEDKIFATNIKGLKNTNKKRKVQILKGEETS